MAVIAIRLGDGQLASSKATLYTCPAGSKVIIKSITLVNTHDTNILTVNLYVNRDGTSRKIIPEDMPMIAKGAYFFSEAVVLEASDLLEGDASSATTIDWTASGVQIV